jgi:hypothetical protein
MFFRLWAGAESSTNQGLNSITVPTWRACVRMRERVHLFRVSCCALRAARWRIKNWRPESTP